MFAVEKRPGSMAQWLCRRRSRPLDADRRNLGADLACFLLLTPLAAASAYLCGSSANYYVNHRQPVGAFGMAFLSTFLFAVYLIWLALTLRSVQSKVYKNWSNKVNYPDSLQVPLQGVDCVEEYPSGCAVGRG